MADDPPLTVTLTPAQSAALRAAITAGEYPDAEAALADALQAWSDREERRRDDLAWVKAKIRASIADPDPDLSEEELEERLQRTFERGARRADEAA